MENRSTNVGYLGIRLLSVRGTDGSRPFQAELIAEIVSAVMEKNPDWDVFRPTRQLVSSFCSRGRWRGIQPIVWRDIGDAWLTDAELRSLTDAGEIDGTSRSRIAVEVEGNQRFASRGKTRLAWTLFLLVPRQTWSSGSVATNASHFGKPQFRIVLPREQHLAIVRYAPLGSLADRLPSARWQELGLISAASRGVTS